MTRSFVCMILAAMCVLLWAKSAQSAPQNLLINGDFESGLAGWELNEVAREEGACVTEQDDRRDGQVCGLENRDEDRIAMSSQTIPADVTQLYTFTGFSRSTPLQEGAGIAVHALDKGGKILQRRWVHQIPSWGLKGWTEFRAEYVPPKGAVRLRVAMAVYKQGKAWFDDLVLTAKPKPKKENPWGEKLTDFGLSAQRIPTPTPVYHMNIHDLDGDGQVELILGDIDNLLRIQTQTGKALWEHDLGGLALGIDCGDVDGDGRPDIVVCSADVQRRIRVFSQSGAVLWSYHEPGKAFGHLTVADVNGDGRAEVFATEGNRLLAFSCTGKLLWEKTFGGPRMRDVDIGDVDGDGELDVVVSTHAQKLFAATFKRDGTALWRYVPVGGPRTAGEDVCAADIDGDGRAEVLVASDAGTVVCVSNGKKRWLARRETWKLWPKHRDATAKITSTPVDIAVHDFVPERPGLETLVTLIDHAWLIDSVGKFIWETQSGLLLLDLHVAPNGEAFLPSSGFRDPSVYRLRWTRDGSNPLAEAELANPISDYLARTYDQVAACKPAAAPDTEKAHVVYASLAWPFSRWGSLGRLRKAHEALSAKENEHLEFVFMLWPKDLPVELHRGQMSEQSEILEVVRFFEELGRPFLFFVDHGCSPNLSLDTMRKTLELAPKTCRGFYVAENTAKYPSAKWEEYVGWAMQVMDLCLEHGGRKFIMKEMYDTWCALPSDPRVRSTLLQPKYRDLIVAMYATNNPHAPELQIGGMIGLKQAGLVSGWGISTQYWNWSWASHGLSQEYPNICPADVIMRMELSAACLGGRWFHIEGGQQYLLRGTDEMDPSAKLHRDLVYELIRKGLLPVADSANLSFSAAVVVRSHHPITDTARDAGKTLGSPRSRPFSPCRTGFLGVDQAVLSAHPAYLPAYAYGVRRYCDTMFAETPYGFLRCVPECSEATPFLEGKLQLVTDGDCVRVGGKNMSADDARGAVIAKLKNAAAELPFSAPGVALYPHRVGDAYRVWMLDPGYMNPKGVETRLTIRLPGDHFEAIDSVTGEQLVVKGKTVPVSVPPGGFRALEVRRR